MEEDVQSKYLRAGEIAKRVRYDALKRLKPGVRVLDFCNYVERKILEYGGKPAFPVNVSINDEAAHYTARIRDPKKVPYPSIVKVDIGVHIDGYIADTAVTAVFSDDPKLHDLAQAAEDALENSLKIVGAGVRFRRIGEVIEKTIKSYGFNPVKNLTGHSLDRYNLHAGASIPNYPSLTVLGRFEAGKAYAIEPFATMGSGYVIDGGHVTIHSLNKPGRAKSEVEKRIVKYVYENFGPLPFSERWLENIASWKVLRRTLEDMVRRGVLRGYPVLVDSEKSMVSQAEHTVIVLDKETIVVTL